MRLRFSRSHMRYSKVPKHEQNMRLCMTATMHGSQHKLAWVCVRSLLYGSVLNAQSYRVCHQYVLNNYTFNHSLTSSSIKCVGAPFTLICVHTQLMLFQFFFSVFVESWRSRIFSSSVSTSLSSIQCISWINSIHSFFIVDIYFVIRQNSEHL